MLSHPVRVCVCVFESQGHGLHTHCLPVACGLVVGHGVPAVFRSWCRRTLLGSVCCSGILYGCEGVCVCECLLTLCSPCAMCLTSLALGQCGRWLRHQCRDEDRESCRPWASLCSCRKRAAFCKHVENPSRNWWPSDEDSSSAMGFLASAMELCRKRTVCSRISAFSTRLWDMAWNRTWC